MLFRAKNKLNFIFKLYGLDAEYILNVMNASRIEKKWKVNGLVSSLSSKVLLEGAILYLHNEIFSSVIGFSS
jgi:hypothetical protein